MKHNKIFSSEVVHKGKTLDKVIEELEQSSVDTIATHDTLGSVIVGDSISVTEEGVINVDVPDATEDTKGIAKLYAAVQENKTDGAPSSDAVFNAIKGLEKFAGIYKASTDLPTEGITEGYWAAILGENGFPAEIYRYDGTAWEDAEETWEPDSAATATVEQAKEDALEEIEEAKDDAIASLSGLPPIENYVKGNLRTLAVGQTYQADEAVKTSDGNLVRMAKDVKAMNTSDIVKIGDLKAANSKTWKALKKVSDYNGGSSYSSGDYAIGRPSIYILTVDVSGFSTAGNISVTIGDVSTEDIPVDSESTAVSVATAIVAALNNGVTGWTITDNDDGTITITCLTGGTNTLTITSDTGETGVTVTSTNTAGASTASKYDGTNWSAASVADMYGDSSLYEEIAIASLISGYTSQNTVLEDISFAGVPVEYTQKDLISGYVKAVYNCNINTSINFNTIQASNDISHITIDVKAGERYHVWVTSNSNYYWPIVVGNSSNKVCGVVKTLVLKDYVYEVPAGAVKMTISSNNFKYFRMYKECGEIAEYVRDEKTADDNLYDYVLLPNDGASSIAAYVDTATGVIKSISTVRTYFYQVHLGDKYKVVRRSNTSGTFSVSYIKKSTIPVVGNKVTTMFSVAGGDLNTTYVNIEDDGYMVVAGANHSVFKMQPKSEHDTIVDNAECINHLLSDDTIIPIDRIGHIPGLDYGQCAIGDTIEETYDTSGWSKIIECEEGDVFVVSGITGYNTFTTFAILDRDNKLICKRNNTVGTFTVYVPKGGAKLYIASNAINIGNARKINRKNSVVSKLNDTIHQNSLRLSAIDGKYSIYDILTPTIVFGGWDYRTTAGSFVSNIENGGISFVIPLSDSNDWKYISVDSKYCFRSWTLASSNNLSVTTDRKLFNNLSGVNRINVVTLKDSVTFNPNYLILEIFHSNATTVASSYELGDINIYIEKNVSENSEKKKVICYGDSLTAGAYPTYLQGFLGDAYEVVNQGIGGQWKNSIFERIGSLPVIATAAFTLPASASSSVTVSVNTNLTYFDVAKYSPCYVLGHKCTFTKVSDNSASISLIESVEHDIPVASGTQIVLEASTNYRNPQWVIVWAGTNGGVGDVSTFVESIKAIERYVNTSNIIVINPHTEVNTSLDTALLNAFTNRFFNWRVYGATSLMYEYGMTPTSTDIEYMNQGLLPSTILNSDRVHLTDTGLHILAEKLAQLIVALGG